MHLKKKEIVEPNFEWIRDTEAFNKVLDMVEENIGLEAITGFKIVNLKSVSKFVDDILSGKINNKYDTEKVYTKIMEDENFLRRYRNFSKNKNVQTIATIISNLGYAVFGPLLPSAFTSVDIENVDIRDIPESDAKNEPKKRIGLKIITPNQLLTRLPILLAQKQTVNNSQKLNNEIRNYLFFVQIQKLIKNTL